jgi:1,4-alpha-glucan branching enzyme
MNVQGYLSLVLHAHLPFVRHPEYPDFLEEDWLYEAITETYVPLLRMMDRLWRDGVDFRLTMSLTPPLCEMLADPLLNERYAARLESLLELARAQEIARAGTPFEAAAAHYVEELTEISQLYNERWGRRLLPVFRSFQDRGRLQILTCGATHGILPLMATDEARHAQIEAACRSYERHFGRRPEGIWLGECAYAPGLEDHLAASGLKFFFVETHGLTRGDPPARLGTARPVLTSAGVAAFARDLECSQQVWSAEVGYPGDPSYREFYRDLGYDLPYEEVRPYLHTDGVRRNVGIKFHRITGRVSLDRKAPYDPEAARRTAASHAAHFLSCRQAQVRYLRRALGVTPHLTAPYDAELYGHWWYEGPIFLEMLLRKAACDQDEVVMITPGEYLRAERVHQEITPSISTWGAEGYFQVWLNARNDWIYRHLHRAEERMIELCGRFATPDALQRRALTQAARELLLAQSSDWAFIITTDTMVEYAIKRTRDHVARFTRLYEQLLAGEVDEAGLAELESRDSCFPDLDYRLWDPAALPARGGSAVYTAPA